MASLGGLPHDFVGPQVPHIESDQVGPSQQPANAQPAQPTTKEVTVNFNQEDSKKPTMELVLKALRREGLDYTNVDKQGGFSSSLPGDDKHPKLGTFTRNDSAGNKFTCFQGDMTFCIKATDKDGNKFILKFTQTIETSVRVPIHGDNREVKDAMMKALFKLEGYRLHIGEPLLAHNNEKIEKLAGKTFLNIAVVREETSEKSNFYNKNILQERHTLHQQLYKPTDCFKSSIMGVKVGTEKETKKLETIQLYTLWTKEPTCDLITNRDKELSTIINLAKDEIAHPQTTNNQIKTLLSNSSQTMNSALTIVVRNTLDNIDDLYLSVDVKKAQIETNIDNSKKAHSEATKTEAQITKLTAQDSLSPQERIQLAKLKEERDSKFGEARTHLDKADSLRGELNTDLENIKKTTRALDHLLNTDGIKLSESNGPKDNAAKVKEIHTENLETINEILKDYKLEPNISDINTHFLAERPVLPHPPTAPNPPLVQNQPADNPPPAPRTRADQGFVLEEVPTAAKPPLPERAWQRSARREGAEPATPLTRQQTPPPPSDTAPAGPTRGRERRIEPPTEEAAAKARSQLEKTNVQNQITEICKTLPSSGFINSLPDICMMPDDSPRKMKEIDISLNQISRQLQNPAPEDKEPLQKLQEALTNYRDLLQPASAQEVRQPENVSPPIIPQQTENRAPRPRQFEALSAQEIAQAGKSLLTKSPQEADLLNELQVICQGTTSSSFTVLTSTIREINRSNDVLKKIEKVDFCLSAGILAAQRKSNVREQSDTEKPLAELKEKLTEYRTFLVSTLTTDQKEAYFWKPVADICAKNQDLSSIVNEAMSVMPQTAFLDAETQFQIAMIDTAIYELKEYTPENPLVIADKDKLIMALTEYKNFLGSTLPTEQRAAFLWEPINDICNKNEELSNIVLTETVLEALDKNPPTIEPLKTALAELRTYKSTNLSLEANTLEEALSKYISFLELPAEEPSLPATAPAAARSPDWEQKPTTPEARRGDMLAQPRTLQPSRAEMAARQAAAAEPVARAEVSAPIENVELAQRLLNRTIIEIKGTEEIFLHRLGTAVELLKIIDTNTPSKNPVIADALRDYQTLLGSTILLSSEFQDNTPESIAKAYASDEFQQYLASSESSIINYDKLIGVVGDLLEKNPKLKKVCADIITAQGRTGSEKGLSVGDFLIVPVQRPIKHRLLLVTLQENTRDTDLLESFKESFLKLKEKIDSINLKKADRLFEELLNKIDKANEPYIDKVGNLSLRDRRPTDEKNIKPTPDEITKLRKERERLSTEVKDDRKSFKPTDAELAKIREERQQTRDAVRAKLSEEVNRIAKYDQELATRLYNQKEGLIEKGLI